VMKTHRRRFLHSHAIARTALAGRTEGLRLCRLRCAARLASPCSGSHAMAPSVRGEFLPDRLCGRRLVMLESSARLRTQRAFTRSA
jgi:hypothetical protein